MAKGYFKVYRIKEEVEHKEIISALKKKDFIEVKLINIPEEFSSKISLSCWIHNASDKKPEWFHAVSPYLSDTDKEKVNNKTRCDLVIFVTVLKDGEKQRVYVLPGSMGISYLQQYLDHQFGLDILSRVYDESQNRITNLNEKAVIGEILASIRYYRYPRTLGQEDDFGKILHHLSVQVTKEQMKEFLPNLFENMGGNNRTVSFTLDGASFFDFKRTLPFNVLLNTVLDLDKLLNLPEKTEFNKTLIPLAPRKDKQTIDKLRDKLKDDILKSIFENEPFDLSICPREFDRFYDSQWVVLPGVNLDDRVPLDELINLQVIRNYFEGVVGGITDSNIRKQKLDRAYDQLSIETYKDGFEIPQTSGNFISYCNAEVSCEGKNYFIFNNYWYELKSGFDDDLNSKYRDRILDSHFDVNYANALQWNDNQSEDDYLRACENNNPDLWLVHPLKIGNYLEVCDMIHPRNDGVDLIFAKKGLNVSVRDFVSQVKITARLFEQEIRQNEKPQITKLYETLMRNDRIPNDLSENDFLDYFTYGITKYRFILILQSQNTERRLRSGEFDSRIAKFSLLEFEEYMRGKGLTFRFVPR